MDGFSSESERREPESGQPRARRPESGQLRARRCKSGQPRTRPAFGRRLRTILIICVVSGAAWLAIYWWQSTPVPPGVAPDTTVLAAPLRGDGMPDYVAALNQTHNQGISAETNAAAVLIDAGWASAALAPPDPAAFDALERASRRPAYFVPLQSNSSLLAATSAHPAMAERIRDALRARGTQSAAAGDPAAAWRDAMTLFRLARLMQNTPRLVDRLAALSLDSGGLDIAREIALGPLAPDRARAMIADLSALPPMDDLASAMDVAERYAVLDAAVRAAHGDYSQTEAGQLLAGATADWNQVLRRLNRYFDDLVDAWRLPTPAARRHAAGRVEQQWAAEFAEDDSTLAALWRYVSPMRRARGTRAVTGYIGSVLAPDPGVLGVVPTVRARGRLVLAGLALAGWRAEQGRYPANLADLAGDWLAVVPADPMTDGPLQYRPLPGGDGYLLYSVGPNARDEAGRRDPAAGQDDIALEVPPPAPTTTTQNGRTEGEYQD